MPLPTRNRKETALAGSASMETKARKGAIRLVCAWRYAFQALPCSHGRWGKTDTGWSKTDTAESR